MPPCYAAHVDAEEFGARIIQFEFERNESADNAAKKGARMYSDFIEVRDGLEGWKGFQNSIDSQFLQGEESHHCLLCEQ